MESRHAQEPEITREELAERIALVRAAKIRALGDLSLAELDAVLPAPPAAPPPDRTPEEAAQLARMAAWRRRNRQMIREKDRLRRPRKDGERRGRPRLYG